VRMVWPGADGAVAARECDILMTLLGRAPHSLVSEPSGEGSASVMPGFVQGGTRRVAGVRCRPGFRGRQCGHRPQPFISCNDL